MNNILSLDCRGLHFPQYSVGPSLKKKLRNFMREIRFQLEQVHLTFNSSVCTVSKHHFNRHLCSNSGWNSPRTSPSSCKRGHERTQSVLKKLHNPATLGVHSAWCWEMCVRYCNTTCDAVGCVSVLWDEFMLSVAGRGDEGNLSLACLMWDNYLYFLLIRIPFAKVLS